MVDRIEKEQFGFSTKQEQKLGPGHSSFCAHALPKTAAFVGRTTTVDTQLRHRNMEKREEVGII
jgi:hypothetical protein